MAIFQKPYSGGNYLIESDSSPMQFISERHVACVFMLDTSGSMGGEPIEQLNRGIQAFKSQAMDAMTKACIDVAIITYGGEVVIAQDFTPVSELNVGAFTAGGNTLMGEALNLALDMIAEQKAKYNQFGTPYFRPWIWNITDGQPSFEDYVTAGQRLNQMERAHKVVGYCVGTQGCNFDMMKEMFDEKRILQLSGLDFASFFEFVSNSLSQVRNSDPNGDTSIAVQPPSTITLHF